MLIERGAAVTSRELAAAAGMSEGTIFNVFADKDDLFAAAYETAVDQAPLERAISEIDPTAPFEQRLIVATRADPNGASSTSGGSCHSSARITIPPSPNRCRTVPRSPPLLGAEAARLRLEPTDAAAAAAGSHTLVLSPDAQR